MASPRYSSTWPVPPAIPIWPIVASTMSFAVTPGARVADVADLDRLRLRLRQALGREHVLDLGRPDADGK